MLINASGSCCCLKMWGGTELMHTLSGPKGQRWWNTVKFQVCCRQWDFLWWSKQLTRLLTRSQFEIKSRGRSMPCEYWEKRRWWNSEFTMNGGEVRRSHYLPRVLSNVGILIKCTEHFVLRLIMFSCTLNQVNLQMFHPHHKKDRRDIVSGVHNVSVQMKTNRSVALWVNWMLKRVNM